MNVFSLLNNSCSKARNVSAFLFCVILSAVSFNFLSCNRTKAIPALEETEVFTLSYGSFEDELNVFNMAQISDVRTSIAMRDGFFYIANSEGQKIMEMNSYGDLLTFYFNEESNRKPSFYDEEKAVITTRKAVSYPFREISSIAVDSRKYLYVVDKMPVERQEIDTDNNLVLSQIVLRFDSNGNFLGYIGQQGPGGMPFPYIKDIFVNGKNELVVVCSTINGYLVYWFTEEGALIHQTHIANRHIPKKDEKATGSWAEIENIVPAVDGHNLYVKVDSFENYVDEASHSQSGIVFSGSTVYSYDVETKTFTSSLEIPSYQDVVTEGYNSDTYNIPYDFLGITESNWLFFVVSTENGFSILMIQNDGSKILRRNLNMNHQDSLFYNFNLNNTGILSMLNIRKDKAVVEWWRTDSLIQSVINN